jgi:hypothetical protein
MQMARERQADSLIIIRASPEEYNITFTVLTLSCYQGFQTTATIAALSGYSLLYRGSSYLLLCTV